MVRRSIKSPGDDIIEENLGNLPLKHAWKWGRLVFVGILTLAVGTGSVIAFWMNKGAEAKAAEIAQKAIETKVDELADIPEALRAETVARQQADQAIIGELKNLAQLSKQQAEDHETIIRLDERTKRTQEDIGEIKRMLRGQASDPSRPVDR